MQPLICPHCASTATKKNGLTFYKKQNYKCSACGRQFVENGQAYFVSEETKTLVNKLLLERISFAGIRRVCGVSESWLHTHLQRLYASQPDDLGASQTLPPMEEYLAERLDEEIERLLARKKNDSAGAIPVGKRSGRGRGSGRSGWGASG